MRQSSRRCNAIIAQATLTASKLNYINKSMLAAHCCHTFPNFLKSHEVKPSFQQKATVFKHYVDAYMKRSQLQWRKVHNYEEVSTTTTQHNNVTTTSMPCSAATWCIADCTSRRNLVHHIWRLCLRYFGAIIMAFNRLLQVCAAVRWCLQNYQDRNNTEWRHSPAGRLEASIEPARIE